LAVVRDCYFSRQTVCEIGFSPIMQRDSITDVHYRERSMRNSDSTLRFNERRVKVPCPKRRRTPITRDGSSGSCSGMVGKEDPALIPGAPHKRIQLYEPCEQVEACILLGAENAKRQGEETGKVENKYARRSTQGRGTRTMEIRKAKATRYPRSEARCYRACIEICTIWRCKEHDFTGALQCVQVVMWQRQGGCELRCD
jgi:hypothetical protein